MSRYWKLSRQRFPRNVGFCRTDGVDSVYNGVMTNTDHAAAATHYFALAVEANIRAHGLTDCRTQRALEMWAALLARDAAS